MSADLSGLSANVNEKNISFHEILPASCPDVDGDNNVAPAHDAAPSRDDSPPRYEDDDNLIEDNDDDDGDVFGTRSLILPDNDNSHSKFKIDILKAVEIIRSLYYYF